MGKLRQLSPELWPLIDIILFSYIELIFRGGVSCLPAALLLFKGKGSQTCSCTKDERLKIAEHFATNFIKINQFIRKLYRFYNSDNVSSKQGCEGMTS